MTAMTPIISLRQCKLAVLATPTFVITVVCGVSVSWGRADKDDTGGNLTWMAAKLETAPDSSAVGVVVQAVVLS